MAFQSELLIRHRPLLFRRVIQCFATITPCDALAPFGYWLDFVAGCEAGERFRRRAAVARAWQPKSAAGVRRGLSNISKNRRNLRLMRTLAINAADQISQGHSAFRGNFLKALPKGSSRLTLVLCPASMIDRLTIGDLIAHPPFAFRLIPAARATSDATAPAQLPRR
jgi:hypothetical protein